AILTQDNVVAQAVQIRSEKIKIKSFILSISLFYITTRENLPMYVSSFSLCTRGDSPYVLHHLCVGTATGIVVLYSSTPLASRARIVEASTSIAVLLSRPPRRISTLILSLP